MALLGANGAGKTTTLRTISGILHPVRRRRSPSTGAHRRLPPHKIVALGISHVPEGRRIFPAMTVQENLEMGAFRQRAASATTSTRASALFPILDERRQQTGGTLSGGEQQMLAIGRALMSRPRLLLLDEPSHGAGADDGAAIFNIIGEIRGDGDDDAARRAERGAGAAARRPRLRAGDRRRPMQDEASVLLGDERVRAAYLGEGAA